MIKRRVADTDISVSPLGLGTVKIGRDKGVKYPQGFSIPSDAAVIDILNLAKDRGINLIDTAPAYGNSEERLGKLLPNRHDWVICSKVGEEFNNTTGQSHFDFTPKHIRYSIERSLKRLNTDFIDMVLVHSDGNDVDIINTYEVLDVLNTLKAEGKIRATGMSTKTVTGGLLTLQHSDCAMVTYNPAHTEEEAVLDYAAEHNKCILLKKALASGHLCTEQNQKDADPVQQSFDFIFAHPGVTSAIIGTINPHHLEDNINKLNLTLGC